MTNSRQNKPHERNQLPTPPPRRRGTDNDKRGLPGPPSRPLRTVAFWVVLVLLALVIFQVAETGRPAEHEVPYSVFRQQVDDGNILRMLAVGQEVEGEFASEIVERDTRGQQVTIKHFKTNLPFLEMDFDLAEMVREKNPGADITARPERFDWWQMTFAWLPIVLIVAFEM